MRYRPELDGIRGVALLAVIACHTNAPLALGGWMAVDVFFVLSGYIITLLLIGEHQRTGDIRIGAFLWRRILRVYPALLLVLLLGALWFRTLGADPSAAGYLKTVTASATYVQNFVWGFGGGEFGEFGHTWSLGVEIQFYLLWPFALAALLRRGRRPMPWILAGIAVSYALFVLQSGEQGNLSLAPAYYLPWTRAWELLIGCALAFWLVRRGLPAAGPTEAPRGRWVGWAIAAFGGFWVLLGATYTIFVDSSYLIWQAPVIALLSAALIAHLDRVHRYGVGRFLGWRPVAMLGLISYSVYLFHLPVMAILRERYGIEDPPALMLWTTPIAIVLAALSYRLVETPVREWGKRLIRRRPAPLVDAPGGGVTPAAGTTPG